MMLVSGALQAESIFLKDGNILRDYSIAKEDDTAVHAVKGGEKRTVARTQILRIHYGKLRDKKLFVYFKDGKEQQLFLVSEDLYTYTFRKELLNPLEIQIQKQKIKMVSDEKIEKTIVFAKTKEGAFYRSMLLPGLGQYYKGQNQRAYWYWGAWGVAVGAATVFGIDYLNKQSAYSDAKAGDDFDTLFSESRLASQRFNIAIVAIGILYIVNLVDVWFGGDIQARLPKNLSQSQTSPNWLATRKHVGMAGLIYALQFKF